MPFICLGQLQGIPSVVRSKFLYLFSFFWVCHILPGFSTPPVGHTIHTVCCSFPFIYSCVSPVIGHWFLPCHCFPFVHAITHLYPLWPTWIHMPSRLYASAGTSSTYLGPFTHKKILVTRLHYSGSSRLDSFASSQPLAMHAGRTLTAASVHAGVYVVGERGIMDYWQSRWGLVYLGALQKGVRWFVVIIKRWWLWGGSDEYLIYCTMKHNLCRFPVCTSCRGSPGRRQATHAPFTHTLLLILPLIPSYTPPLLCAHMRHPLVHIPCGSFVFRAVGWSMGFRKARGYTGELTGTVQN